MNLDDLERKLDALVLGGETAMDAGDIATARQAFEAVLEVHPTHPRALADLGVVDQLGEVERAENLLLKAAMFADDPADSLLNLSAIAEARGDLATAATYLCHPALAERRDVGALRQAVSALKARGRHLAVRDVARTINLHRTPSVNLGGYYEVRILDLEQHQIYPPGTQLSTRFFFNARHHLIDKQTPIASIGSCFAREVKDYLVRNGYRYVQTAQGPHARHGSAAWDRVFNTFCLRQEFERALDVFEPRVPAWVMPDGRRVDPFRKGVVWRDLEHQLADLDHHQRTAREALLACEAVVVTVGLNEIWHDRKSPDVFFQVPPAEVFDEDEHAFRIATVDENIANLERMWALLQQHNPDCKMLITVSPVPLRATFRKDDNVVVSNVESKSTLLVAVKRFVAAHDGVYYFPSYELVTAVLDTPFEPDNRHVKRSTVGRIMQVFEHAFLRDEPAPPEADSR